MAAEYILIIERDSRKNEEINRPKFLCLKSKEMKVNHVIYKYDRISFCLGYFEQPFR
jgi:hypothetical protein